MPKLIKGKIDDIKAPKVEDATIDYFFLYTPANGKAKTGIPMVRIKGNFMGGGFNVSKNKVKAILAVSKKLAGFIDGDLDEEISKLKEGEYLVFDQKE